MVLERVVMFKKNNMWNKNKYMYLNVFNILKFVFLFIFFMMKGYFIYMEGNKLIEK